MRGRGGPSSSAWAAASSPLSPPVAGTHFKNKRERGGEAVESSLAESCCNALRLCTPARVLFSSRPYFSTRSQMSGETTPPENEAEERIHFEVAEARQSSRILKTNSRARRLPSSPPISIAAERNAAAPALHARADELSRLQGVFALTQTPGRPWGLAENKIFQKPKVLKHSQRGSETRRAVEVRALHAKSRQRRDGRRVCSDPPPRGPSRRIFFNI